MNIFKCYLISKLENKDPKRIKSHVFRGVLMDYLGRLDPKLVERLHVDNEIRPYAISYRRDRKIKEMIEFRITSLLEDVSQKLLNSLLNTSNLEMNIQGDPYLLVKIGFEKISYQEMIKNARIIKKFNIKFITPTYFTLKGRKLDLKIPLPENLFGNLGTLWNAHVFKSEQIPLDELINYVKSSVSISSFRLETRFADIGKKFAKSGCVGWCNYLIENTDDPLNVWLDILLNFAEYSNIGGNRTAGMGVVRYNCLELAEKMTNEPKISDK
ncbi:MAG: CRISPR system precrRNA processing endoribonuclease RAMP protein Cas6 [Candidatus Helarchaeota archaeon]